MPRHVQREWTRVPKVLVHTTALLKNCVWIKTSTFNPEETDGIARIGEFTKRPNHSTIPKRYAFRKRCQFALELSPVLKWDELLNARTASLRLRRALHYLAQFLILESCKSLIVHFAG